MKLKIKSDGKVCHCECPFKNGGDWCLLFKENMTPVYNYGVIDEWKVCDACSIVQHNYEQFKD